MFHAHARCAQQWILHFLHGLLCISTMQAWAALEGKLGDAKKAQRLFEAAAKAEPGNPKLLNAWATFERCW